MSKRLLQIEANGLSIRCAVSGQGKPLILIHGGEADHSMFDRMAEDLATDFTVLAYDQRDSGETRDLSPATRAYGLTDLGDDVAALIVALGYPRVHVFGTSLGGHIAQVLAVRHPDKIDALILSSTWMAGSGLDVANPAAAKQLAVWRSDVANHAGDIARLFFTPCYLSKHPERVEMFRSSRRTPEQSRRRSDLLGTPYLIQECQISARTLLLMGDADALIPAQATLAIARFLKRYESNSMAGLGHVSAIEAPGNVAKHIREFLQTNEDSETY
jgi:pimeloyl-ACP methyl ester carboxylesterase